MAEDEIQMTPRRAETLKMVAETPSRVVYDARTATYRVDGEKAANWDFRTLSELRQAGLIRPQRVTGESEVRPTQEGQKVLRNLP